VSKLSRAGIKGLCVLFCCLPTSRIRKAISQNIPRVHEYLQALGRYYLLRFAQRHLQSHWMDRDQRHLRTHVLNVYTYIARYLHMYVQYVNDSNMNICMSSRYVLRMYVQYIVYIARVGQSSVRGRPGVYGRQQQLWAFPRASGPDVAASCLCRYQWAGRFSRRFFSSIYCFFRMSRTAGWLSSIFPNGRRH
jgi:hypothetical protein